MLFKKKSILYWEFLILYWENFKNFKNFKKFFFDLTKKYSKLQENFL